MGDIGTVHSVTTLVVIVFFAVGLGIFLGCSLVYAFNHMPARWLCDYGQEPSEKVLSPHRQRLPGSPWKWVFSATFIAFAIYTGVNHWVYGIAALAAVWFLFQIIIGDFLYRIIADEMVIGLTVTAFGFIPFHSGIKEMIFGALLGGGLLLFLAMLGKWVVRNDVMGFGDVKLGMSMGFILGLRGTLVVLPVGLVLGGVVGAVLLLSKRRKGKDEIALGPYLGIPAILYLVFIMIP